MTYHPCHGMTKAQREAFERIAINEPPRASKKTIQALLDQTLIAVTERTLSGGALGPIVIHEYFVPLPVHAQWCEWCSEQPGIAV